MRLRLLLATVVAGLAAAPLAGSSHATIYCNEQLTPKACAAITAVCQSTDLTSRLCSVT